MTPSSIRKVYQGTADRRQMFRMFDRHAQRPIRADTVAAEIYCGEWFEIGQVEHDYMFEILPPLWMRGDMFAMREFLAGSITSIFFELKIDGRVRCFHGYCDLADRQSPERMRAAIVERECRPVRALSQEERLEHIWSSTHDPYRGYADWRFARADRGKRTIIVYSSDGRKEFQLLDRLTDAQIAMKLPIHLRHLPDAIAA